MKLAYVVLAALILCAACSKDRKAPNGFKVEVIREGSGDYAKPGQYLVMNMMYKDSKDSVWIDTKTRNIPVIIPVPDTSELKNEKGLESSFRVLKKGDSVRLNTNVRDFYANTRRDAPSKIDPAMTLSFFFGVKDIVEREGFEKLVSEIQTREAEKGRVKQLEQVGQDSVAIDEYLAKNNIKAQRAVQGIRYVLHKEGKGEKPTVANTLRLTYKVTLLATGAVIEQSQGIVEFPLSGMIQGWQLGFPYIPKGSKATLYVPSSLGYGPNGYPPDIPPNANLIFDIELVDVK
jgi:FKBP-type peptidyl-prolyl cis-trans isomerase FkpA